MTDALDRAMRAFDDAWNWESNEHPELTEEDFDRVGIAAALQVMADDIRKQTATWHYYEAYADAGEVYAACADLMDEILEDYGV